MMSVSIRVKVLMLMVDAALLCGCSHAPEKTYPVHGVVKLKGVPLTGGSVIFEPVEAVASGKRYSARGAIGSDGGYRLSTFSRDDGAVAGEHRIAVLPKEGDSPMNFGKSNVPATYRSTDKSQLTYKVQTGDNTFDIQMH